MWTLHGSGEQKSVQGIWVTWPRWPPCPYMIKTFKNLLLWNQKANGLGPWYVALGFWAHQNCSNDDLGLTLIYFMARPSSDHPPFSKIFFSKTAGPIEAKFHVDPPWVGGTKVCSGHLGHMTKMAAMPIYDKNLQKSSSMEPKGQWPWALVCSIGVLGPSKLFKWWPWVDLDLFYGKAEFMLLYGKIC